MPKKKTTTTTTKKDKKTWDFRRGLLLMNLSTVCDEQNEFFKKALSMTKSEYKALVGTLRTRMRRSLKTPKPRRAGARTPSRAREKQSYGCERDDRGRAVQIL